MAYLREIVLCSHGLVSRFAREPEAPPRTLRFASEPANGRQTEHRGQQRAPDCRPPTSDFRTPYPHPSPPRSTEDKLIPMWPQSQETQELLAEARAGDAEAVNRLLERHRAALRRMIDLRMDHLVQRRVDASDIVQDVLLEAHRRLDDCFARACRSGLAARTFIWARAHVT